MSTTSSSPGSSDDATAELHMKSPTWWFAPSASELVARRETPLFGAFRRLRCFRSSSVRRPDLASATAPGAEISRRCRHVARCEAVPRAGRYSRSGSVRLWVPEVHRAAQHLSRSCAATDARQQPAAPSVTEDLGVAPADCHCRSIRSTAHSGVDCAHSLIFRLQS
jgi:hypothetical protein